MSWIKGLIWGITGMVVGGALMLLFGQPLWSEPMVAGAYTFFLVGWLLGAGVWDHWARGWFGLENRPTPTQQSAGTARYFAFSTDHKVIGIQYLVTFVTLFLLAGFAAVLMRIELMNPGRDIMGPGTYNTVMSFHGIVMVAVAVAALIGGLGNYFVPLMIGAQDMAFPRLNALSYWLTPPVALAIVVGMLLPGGFNAGWTVYPPLSAGVGIDRGTGLLLFLLGFLTFGLSSIIGGLNFLVTVVRLRAPGMTWDRLPIFVWGVFTASILALIFTQFVATALFMVLFDRVFGMAFFAPDQGGGALLYQHVFWFYSHPAVYVMILPGFGLMLEIVTHFSRKPLFGYKWAVAAMLAITGLSGVVWAHHMFTSGMSYFLNAAFLISTELISIPTGLIFLSALGTIWMAKMRVPTPMLFALAVIFNFSIGGLTGIFNADAPTDMHLHDTYWVVGHFHYTIVGGEIFALLAGIYYWFPKFTGRMYNEKLGKLHFWAFFLTFQAIFAPMMWLGYLGMNRRVADYSPELGQYNWVLSLVAFVLSASFLVFVYNMVVSWVKGPQAESNPWKLRTLDWLTSSPPSEHNFPHDPQVTGNPYDYGVPGMSHAVVRAGEEWTE